MFAKLAEVVDLVPRDVQRDARGEAGERVHLGSIGDLLERIARYPELSEHLEPGARVPVGPRWHFDCLPFKLR